MRRSAAIAAVMLVVAGCGGDDEPAGESTRAPGAGTATTAPTATTAATSTAPLRVRLLSAADELRSEPVARIEVSARGEGGLLGVALDPQFADNGFVYLYYTTAGGMRVARHRFENGSLGRVRVILDGIEAGAIHDSGRIGFGPDERLYVLTGDAGRPELAQRRDSRNGKVLRLSAAQYRGAGGEPETVSLGHRNPQGLDWEPGSDRLIATEHGPDCCDEINAIRAGSNYGWPLVTGDDHGDFTAPLTFFQTPIAPSGSTFVTRGGSAWTGDYLVAALRGEQLRRLTFDGDRVIATRRCWRAASAACAPPSRALTAPSTC